MKVCHSCHRCYEEQSVYCVTDKSVLSNSPPANPFIAKKYRLDWLIGHGRLGIAFEGTALETDRRVAIKLLLPDLSGTLVDMKQFRAEAYAVAHLNTRIDQQHVARTYDYGTLTEGTPYVVMELVEGEPLNKFLKRSGPFSVSDAEYVAGQIADGLEAAHRAGVVHGNLKLSNIFVNQDRHDRFEVKILDFGYTRMRTLLPRHNGEPDQTLSAEDTLHYISPEQRRRRHPNERADVYSLGVILYELLAGRPITIRNTPVDEISFADYLTPLRELRDDVPEALWQLIRHSLDTKSTSRPWSAAVFARQLRGSDSPELPVPAVEFAFAGDVTIPRETVKAAAVPVIEAAPEVSGIDHPVGEPGPTAAPPETKSPQRHVIPEEMPSIEPDNFSTVDEAPYVEEEAWEVEQVDRVLNGTVPTGHSRPGISTPAVGRALNSVSTILAGASARLTGPKTVHVSILLICSLIAAYGGVVIGNWLASGGTEVSQAKSPATPATPEAPQPAAELQKNSDEASTTDRAVPDATQLKPTALSPSDRTLQDSGDESSVDQQVIDQQGEEQALRAVYDQWLQATNNRDVDSQSKLYNDKIETFYGARRASLNYVLEHKSQVYQKASSIDMRASPPEIKIDDRGQTATMRFRKEWVIKGKSNSRGRATQELQLVKTSEGWKISGERNVSGE